MLGCVCDLDWEGLCGAGLAVGIVGACHQRGLLLVRPWCPFHRHRRVVDSWSVQVGETDMSEVSIKSSMAVRRWCALCMCRCSLSEVHAVPRCRILPEG